MFSAGAPPFGGFKFFFGLFGLFWPFCYFFGFLWRDGVRIFFFKLKEGGVPVTIKEFLTLLEAMRKGVAANSMDQFYYLARVCLVKDESHFDRFNRVFAAYFRGLLQLPPDLLAQIPEDWLRKQAELLLSDEDKDLIKSLGGWEKLMETLRKRLEEQQGRHQGG